MRQLFERTIEMGRRHQMAQIVIAGLVLRIEREPVEHGLIAAAARPQNAKHRADDGLDAPGDTAIGKRHAAVQPVAVGHGDGRKAALFGDLAERLGLDCPVEHGVSGKDAQGNERHGQHGRVSLADGARFAKAHLPAANTAGG